MRRKVNTLGDLISCNFGVQGMTVTRSQLIGRLLRSGSGKVCSEHPLTVLLSGTRVCGLSLVLIYLFFFLRYLKLLYF